MPDSHGQVHGYASCLHDPPSPRPDQHTRTHTLTSPFVPPVPIDQDIPLEAEILIDCLYCMLQACMQSQAENELDFRKPKPGTTTAQPGATPEPR